MRVGVDMQHKKIMINEVNEKGNEESFYKPVVWSNH